MATPTSRTIALAPLGNVRLTIKHGINNGVSFGFALWDPDAQTYGPSTSGSAHELDPSPPEYELGAPRALKSKRLVIGYRFAITDKADGNVYRVDALLEQEGGESWELSYSTDDASENGAYNELNAFFN